MASPELQAASDCLESGRFKEAFDRLRPVYRDSDVRHRFMRGELFWRLGEYERAKSILEPFVSTDSVDSSKALEALGSIARDEGDPAGAKRFLERSVKKAQAAQNSIQVCYSQLALWGVLLNLEGTHVCESIANDVRLNVLRVGNPRLTSLLHARSAEFEARRGNSDRAFRHIDAGLHVVAKNANVWIEGSLWLVRSAVEWVSGRITQALRSARRARAVAAISGHRQTEFGALANLGYIGLFSGGLEAAHSAIVDAERFAPRGGQRWMMVKETEANLELIRGNRAACLAVLQSIEIEQKVKGWSVDSFPFAEVLVARARLARAESNGVEALELLREASRLAAKRGDRPVQTECQLEIADVALGLGRRAEALRAFDEAVIYSEGSDLARTADLNWLNGRFSSAAGDEREASVFFSRARRIWSSCGGYNPHRIVQPGSIGDDPVASSATSAWTTLAGVASVLRLGGRPDVLAGEAFSLLAGERLASRVRLVRFEPGRRRVAFERGLKSADGDLIRVPIEQGESTGCELEITVSSAEGTRVRVAAVVSVVRAAIELHKHRQEERYRSSLWPTEEGLLLEGNLFVAPRMRDLRTAARRVGPGNLPVLITGETGAGKEVLAREVHEASPRARKPFAVFVCSAVPRDMLDSHLFGHRRGAFTGAIDNFPGILRANEGGTLLLDEIGEVSLDQQVKFLRFLETGEVHPLGETRPVKVDVRIIAATNQPLEKLIAEGRFREDLYYRLNVVRFLVPALRDRREEILPFFEHFLTRECSNAGRPVPSLSDAAVEHLLLYRWPGNVRQLYNEVRRILSSLPDGEDITPDVLAPVIVEERRSAIAAAIAAEPHQALIRTNQPLQGAIEDLERVMISRALKQSGDLETAAQSLDITRKGLFLKRQRLGLD